MRCLSRVKYVCELLFIMLLMCSERESLFEPGKTSYPTISAFICRTEKGASTDTNLLMVIDTVEPDSMEWFVGVILPKTLTYKSSHWAFGDGQTSIDLVCSHSYKESGIYKAILSIVDNLSDTATDTVVVCVNHKPQSIDLTSPLPGAMVDTLNPLLAWLGKDSDSYDSLLEYLLVINTRSSPFDTLLRWSKLMQYRLQKSIQLGDTVNWFVMCRDSYHKIISSGTSTFFAPRSNNSSLSRLAILSGQLSPKFDPSIYQYTDTVNTTDSSIKIVALAADRIAQTTINGNVFNPDSVWGAIKLARGMNTIIIVVTARDGTTSSTYKVFILRKLSSNSLLSNLIVSEGTLSPSFAVTTYNYADTVSFGISEVSISAIVDDMLSSVSFSGSPVSVESTSKDIRLQVGSNPIIVAVNSQDKSSTKEYRLNIVRIGNNIADICSLSVSSGRLIPQFNSLVYNYSDTVDLSATSISILARCCDSNSTLKIGNIIDTDLVTTVISIAEGSNQVPIIVAAQDGKTQKQYVITILKPHNYAGNWLANTSQGMSLFFRVNQMNRVDSVFVEYSINGDICNTSGGIKTSIADRPVYYVHDNAFTVNITSNPVSYMIKGTFTTSTSATGSVDFNLYSSNPPNPICQGTASATWNAMRK